MKVPCKYCGALSVDLTKNVTWKCKHCSTAQEFVIAKKKYNISDTVEIWGNYDRKEQRRKNSIS
jgi:ribosomal protein L37AE/L43A